MAGMRRFALSMALAAAVGCTLDPPEGGGGEYYMLRSQMVGAIIRKARQEDLLGKARRGEPGVTTMTFDLKRFVCDGSYLARFGRRPHEPTRLDRHVLHSKDAYYEASQKYDEIAYFCMQDYVWYYQYKDKEREVIYGPFLVDVPKLGGGPGPGGH